MCGISGICSLDSLNPPDPKTLMQMISIMPHRGPDEAGIYIDNQAGLGHARLSIIDLSSGGQPIHNEDHTLWIIYNGETFNYPELRDKLLSRGHQFYTTSDTEVILHLYEEYGPECLKHMNGQYGLAIWNNQTRELFLARDRIGIRPVHYTVQNNTLYFSSEIKSLLTLNEIPNNLDPLALEEIFTFWTTLSGRTLFKDIHELPPGHYLLAKNGQIRIQKYWQLDFAAPQDQNPDSVETIQEETDEILTDAIRIRLRADVPVGSYLSGGLDSSGITAKIARHFNNNLQTFGIRFEEAAFDEGKHQRQMVAHLNVAHTEMLATNKLIAESFPDVIYHTEKPLLRTAPTPLFLLSKKVNESGLKVVLTGEGADEMFGGYNIFREAKIRNFWARQPDSSKRADLLKELYPYILNNPRLAGTLKSFFAKDLENTSDPLYSHKIRWMNTSKIKTFFSQDTQQAIGSYDCYQDALSALPEGFNNWPSLSKAQYLESTIFLSNYLLSSQGDRMAMAHSLEIRLPYLDYRLMEYMSRVPSRWKILGLNEKFLLKKLFNNILPDSITYRSKHPYRAPITQTLLSNSTEYIEGMLSSASIAQAGIFDTAKTQRLIQKLRTSKNISEVDGMALAGILSTQIINDRFIQNRPQAASTVKNLTVFVDKRSPAVADNN